MARYVENERDTMYRIFLTDALQAIANNTTNHVGLNGAVEIGTKVKYRWLELIHPELIPRAAPVDNRPAEVVAKDIWKRAKFGR